MRLLFENVNLGLAAAAAAMLVLTRAWIDSVLRTLHAYLHILTALDTIAQAVILTANQVGGRYQNINCADAVSWSPGSAYQHGQELLCVDKSTGTCMDAAISRHHCCSRTQSCTGTRGASGS